jgi:hypothetical protein
MVNACYPMSIPEERTPHGLTPVYSASADEHIVRFARDEKPCLFTALGQVIPNHRRRIRIFSPLSSLRALVRQYDDTPDTKAHLPYPCRGGLDFFYVRSEDAMTFPCGFRGQENLGRFVRFNLDRHRKKTGNRAWCLECDWECFRDPSDLFGPLTDLARPGHLLNHIRKDPGFFPTWIRDLRYYRACDFFDGRKSPNLKRLARFS